MPPRLTSSKQINVLASAATFVFLKAFNDYFLQISTAIRDNAADSSTIIVGRYLSHYLNCLCGCLKTHFQERREAQHMAAQGNVFISNSVRISKTFTCLQLVLQHFLSVPFNGMVTFKNTGFLTKPPNQISQKLLKIKLFVVAGFALVFRQTHSQNATHSLSQVSISRKGIEIAKSCF